MCRLLDACYSNILIQFSASYSYQIFLNVILKADFSRYELWKEN